MKRLLCFFGLHDWYYARGRSKGILTGGVRRTCVRRECIHCHAKQEVDRFREWFISKNGDFFFSSPRWVNCHTTNLNPSPRWDKQHEIHKNHLKLVK